MRCAAAILVDASDFRDTAALWTDAVAYGPRELKAAVARNEGTGEGRFGVPRGFERKARSLTSTALMRPAGYTVAMVAIMDSSLKTVLPRLFSELVEGARDSEGAFILNPGDPGLLQSLDKLSAAEASRSAQQGATIAAHAEHVRYGLSLMNRWAETGGNPFADARWEDAWKESEVAAARWEEIRAGLAEETRRWLHALAAPREVSETELSGMIGSVAHLAYHLGAIRQITREARGPRDGAPTGSA